MLSVCVHHLIRGPTMALLLRSCVYVCALLTYRAADVTGLSSPIWSAGLNLQSVAPDMSFDLLHDIMERGLPST